MPGSSERLLASAQDPGVQRVARDAGQARFDHVQPALVRREREPVREAMARAVGDLRLAAGRDAEEVSVVGRPAAAGFRHPHRSVALVRDEVRVGQLAALHGVEQRLRRAVRCDPHEPTAARVAGDAVAAAVEREPEQEPARLRDDLARARGRIDAQEVAALGPAVEVPAVPGDGFGVVDAAGDRAHLRARVSQRAHAPALGALAPARRSRPRTAASRRPCM